jgi:hypothetical protein
MRDYALKILDKLRHADVEFEDKVVAGYLLKGLGRNKYEGLVRSLERDESLNTSAVRAKLLLEEKREMLEDEREEAERKAYEERKRNEELDQNKALAVNTPMYQQYYQRPVFQTSRSSWRKGETSNKIRKGGVPKEGQVVCFKCERVGHIAKFCTETVDKITPNDV